MAYIVMVVCTRGLFTGACAEATCAHAPNAAGGGTQVHERKGHEGVLTPDLIFGPSTDFWHAFKSAPKDLGLVANAVLIYTARWRRARARV